MNIRALNKLIKEINGTSGVLVTGTRKYRRGDYSIDVCDTRSGYPFVIDSAAEWDDLQAQSAFDRATADCYETPES